MCVLGQILKTPDLQAAVENIASLTPTVFARLSCKVNPCMAFGTWVGEGSYNFQTK